MRKYIFIIILLFVVSYKPYAAMAQVKLETALPNVSGAPAPSSGLPGYINYLFIFGLGLIAFLALAQMMIGGLTYILAAGNVADKITAKDTIKQALIGLGLLLVSYLLLNTINPDLVNLKNPKLTPTQFQDQTPSAPIGPLTGQQCQIDTDCTIERPGSGLVQLVCQNNQCVEFTISGGW